MAEISVQCWPIIVAQWALPDSRHRQILYPFLALWATNLTLQGDSGIVLVGSGRLIRLRRSTKNGVQIFLAYLALLRLS
jgi:hypothetical protein